jgi:O-antigen ligase
MCLQLLPAPGSLLVTWSPARDAFLRRHDLLYAVTSGSAWHSISINAEATGLALSCFVAFSLLAVGTARWLSTRSAARLAKGITAFGLLLALFAVAQNLHLTGQTGEGRTVYIYGFWPDPYVNKPFGPFINKNNFAGWMLMALPLALGLLAAKLRECVRTVRPEWRSRVLWLSSRAGAEALFAAVAALAMGVALMMSMSRSGIVALAVTVLMVAWFVPGAASGRRSRIGRIAAAVMLLAALSAWVGTAAIAQRFSDGTDTTMIGRAGAWKDAVHIFRDFPIVGTGVNTFATAMLIYQRSDANNFWEEAHNDYLQILAEGGIVGALLAALALAAIVNEIRRRFREKSPARPGHWIRVGAVAGLLAIGLQELVEFSLQIAGNAALFAALLGLALHRPPRSRWEPLLRA